MVACSKGRRLAGWPLQCLLVSSCASEVARVNWANRVVPLERFVEVMLRKG